MTKGFASRYLANKQVRLILGNQPNPVDAVAVVVDDHCLRPSS
jgi:hypothetical protein